MTRLRIMLPLLGRKVRNERFAILRIGLGKKQNRRQSVMLLPLPK